MTRRSPSSLRSPDAKSQRDPAVLDFAGIGFGPSNLAVAVAARELDAGRKGLFFERNPAFQWHSGMVLDGATMQISFLKDLATLRDPASPYTFLQYLKAKGRLERFVNLRAFYPTRLEYHDYLSWVAQAFAGQVCYGSTVTRVSPAIRAGERLPWCFRLEVSNAGTGEVEIYHARDVIYAPGGKPRIPPGVMCGSPRVIHSSEFLLKFHREFADQEREWELVIAGDGQSAGEIVAHLLARFPRARIHLLASRCALRATDDSHFVNEQFTSQSLEAFYKSGPAQRQSMLSELANTNYGVIDAGLIEDLYRTAYLDEVRDRRRLVVHPFSKLTRVLQNGGRLQAEVQDRLGASPQTMTCDGVVLATGYERGIDPSMFADVLAICERDAAGNVVLSPTHRLLTVVDMPCGIYVQGCAEASFGPGETLLSVLPFRAEAICREIMDRGKRRQAAHSPSYVARAGYPPGRHVETSEEKLYAVIERFRFATLISVDADRQPVVTHVPLILDRSRGLRGVLFGHMDRANPHVELLDRHPIVAIFHGPNAYISPNVYATEQLPTWNSIAVHVRGRARIVEQPAALVAGLCEIARRSDGARGAFRLDPEDPRIGRMIDFIVGFEIEIEEMTGRFKLSQDRTEADRRRAACALARHTETGERAFIEGVVGLSLGEAQDMDGPRVVPTIHERRVS